jgi:hypothetical protein
MGREDFMNQLRLLGFEPSNPTGDRVIFDFAVPVGKYIGEKLQMGFLVGDDWPRTPPSGPHISPQLLPITGGGGVHPAGGIHNSDFGPAWEYWSRPCTHWANTDRTVKAYMAHINRLFEVQ